MNNSYEDAQVEYHDICEQAKEIVDQYEDWNDFISQVDPEFKGKHGAILKKKIQEYFNKKSKVNN